MALAEYNDLYWFPSGALARNITARVFLLNSNTLAPLWADAEGTIPLANPLTTDNDGRLRFYTEVGVYWVHIDSETFRVGVGVSDEGVTPEDVANAVAAHSADTTAVHGIANTANLETQAGAQAKADAATAAHAADTTNIHGIPDTASLETQAGAQAKATAAAEGVLDEAIGAVNAHAAQTQDVHGISDTSNLETQSGAQDKADAARDQAIAASEGAAGEAVAVHAADTTGVHGIANTALLETQAGAQAKANAAQSAAVATAAADATTKANAARAGAEQTAQSALDAHAGDTTGVHGIADTSALETASGAQAKADAAQAAAAADLAAHAADTTNVHGIPDTSLIPSSAQIEEVAADLAAHSSLTTNVHGIPDTALLETQAGAQAKANQARDEAIAAGGEGGGQALLDHIADTTDVHGIPNTANLETQAGAQAKADAAEDSATAAAQAALDLHAADTTNVHGIADTASLETVTGAQAKVDTHAADTTAVHGIADTAALETTSGAQAKADAAVAAHSLDTTNVHGIGDTSVLETQSGAQDKADAAAAQALDAAVAALDAHATDTTAVHGIPDTAALETAAGAQAKVDAHAADTTNVHGIPDTSALLTQGAVDQVEADLAAHAADTTAVHGIADTSLLETLAGSQGRADAARDQAVADAATKYLNRVTGGTVTGPLTLEDPLNYRPGAATDAVVDGRLTGETQPRFYQNGTGQMWWGPGENLSLDTTLYRDTYYSLVTDGDFTVNQTLFGTYAYFNGIVEADLGTTNRETAMRPNNRWETMSRLAVSGATTITSGNLALIPLWMPFNKVITHLGSASAGTAGAGLTNQWFILFNNNRDALCRTADAGTAAWAANTTKQLAIAQTRTAASATTFTTTYSGLYYLGIMIAGTTPPSLASEGTAPGINLTAPTWGGANTGMTTPPTINTATWTANAPTGSGWLYYGFATVNND